MNRLVGRSFSKSGQILASLRAINSHYIINSLKPIISLASHIKPKIRDLHKQVRLLSYHSISEKRDLRNGFYFTVSPSFFREQMYLLKEFHYNVISLNELYEFIKEEKSIPSWTAVLIFEDGYADNYLFAFPILKEFGFRATFFPVAQFIDSGEIFPWLKERAYAGGENLSLSSEQISKMSREGMDFGSHGMTHRKCITLTLKEAESEFSESKRKLEEILNKPIIFSSYPYGSLNDFNGVHKALLKKIGYKMAVSSLIGSYGSGADLFELKSIPIYGTDTLQDFKRKIEGSYDWLGVIQREIAQLKAALLKFGFVPKLLGDAKSKHIPSSIWRA